MDWPLEPGDYTAINSNSSIAICTLGDDIKISSKEIAISGKSLTENLGVERIVLNTISNPNIRFLIVCGDEINGHKCGQAIVSLWKNGIDKNKKIKGADGALPYLQNIPNIFVERFRKQIKVINLIGIKDKKIITKEIEKILKKKSKPFTGKTLDFKKYIIKEEVVDDLDIDIKGNSIIVSPEYNLILNPQTGRVLLKK